MYEYIYIERERDVCIYIYIYIHTYSMTMMYRNTCLTWDVWGLLCMLYVHVWVDIAHLVLFYIYIHVFFAGHIVHTSCSLLFNMYCYSPPLCSTTDSTPSNEVQILFTSVVKHIYLVQAECCVICCSSHSSCVFVLFDIMLEYIIHYRYPSANYSFVLICSVGTEGNT